MTELERAALDYRSALEVLHTARENRANAEKLIAGCQANERSAEDLVIKARQNVIQLAAGDQWLHPEGGWPVFGGFYAKTDDV